MNSKPVDSVLPRLASIAILLVGAITSASAATPERPNIIFILADDLGYGDISCFGQTKIQTPHLDRLAAEGMRFTHAYSGATICSPSRNVLLTGQHTGHTTIRGNMADSGGLPGFKGDRPVRRMHLKEEDRTLGHVLGAAGYRTATIGKWHLDGFNPKAGPLDRGFDEFHGWLVSEPSTYSSTYFAPARFHNRELVTIAANQDGRQGYYHPDACMNEAGQFLVENRDRPFFLYLALNLPHSPYEAPRFGPYANRDWPEPMKHYAFMVHYVDVVVGRLMAQLAVLGLDERTLVFFASDNGPRSEPEVVQTQVVEFFDSNGPLRGYKRDLTDGGIRVPAIARWPGKIPAGTTCDVPWYFADILPTLAELAGAATPEGVDGISIAPVLLGEAEDLPERFMYWEDLEGPFEQAVRWGRWKAIRRGLEGAIELYDVVADPGETNDVVAEQPAVVARITEYLRTARVDSPEYHVHE